MGRSCTAQQEGQKPETIVRIRTRVFFLSTLMTNYYNTPDEDNKGGREPGMEIIGGPCLPAVGGGAKRGVLIFHRLRQCGRRGRKSAARMP